MKPQTPNREVGKARTTKQRRLRHWLRWLSLLAVLGAAFVLWLFRPFVLGNPPRIPKGAGTFLAPAFIGREVPAKALTFQAPEKHPFLADTDSSNMHADAWASDVHVLGGPLGRTPEVLTYAHGRVGGECATVTFDSHGHVLSVCATFSEFSLVLMEPESLKPLAALKLPPRKSNATLNLRKIMSDTSGGAYFFLDQLDRAVLIDADQRLLIVAHSIPPGTGAPVFTVVNSLDLQPTLERFSSNADTIHSVLPDWSGRYWFVSRKGMVGVVSRDLTTIAVQVLENEIIQNSFAVDSSGVYIVSDKALYAFDSAGITPTVRWREPYEVSTRDKPGILTRGSGTTPTLLEGGLVAIADNADPQMNVLVFRRDADPLNTQRLVCSLPLFPPGQSATENSFIGIGSTLLIENNYGYDLFPTMMFGRRSTGGFARVDVDAAAGRCNLMWSSSVVSQTTVPKLSLETGLVYVYAKKDLGWPIDAYYLTALDFETGETVFEVLAGTGVSFDNNWAPITLGGRGCAFVGVLRGLIRICDRKVQ